MKINFLNLRLHRQLWIRDRKDICNSKKGVKHVCPCQRLQVGFLHEVVGWEETLHLWTKAEINLSLVAWRKGGDASLMIGTGLGLHSGMVSWANPQTSNMRSGLNCTAWMTGWGNYETIMEYSGQWALYREKSFNIKGNSQKQIHCPDIINRPNKWENSRPRK